MPKIGKFTAELKRQRLNLKKFCEITGIKYGAAKEWNRKHKEIPAAIRAWLDQRDLLIDFSKEILKEHNSLEKKAAGQECCHCIHCENARKILYP